MFLFGDVDSILFLEVPQGGVLGFGRFFNLGVRFLHHARTSGRLAVADVAGFAVEQGIFVGVSELVAYFFAVLVFLIHVVGDNGEDDG